MRPAVDDIDFMQSDRMNHFLPLLQLALRTLNEPGLLASGIVVSGSGKRSPKAANFA